MSRYVAFVLNIGMVSYIAVDLNIGMVSYIAVVLNIGMVSYIAVVLNIGMVSYIAFLLDIGMSNYTGWATFRSPVASSRYAKVSKSLASRATLSWRPPAVATVSNCQPVD